MCPSRGEAPVRHGVHVDVGQGSRRSEREELCVAGRVRERRSAERGVDHAVQAVFAADYREAVNDGEGGAFAGGLIGDSPVAGSVRAGALGLGGQEGAGLGGIAGVQHDRSLQAMRGERECVRRGGAAEQIPRQQGEQLPDLRLLQRRSAS